MKEKYPEFKAGIYRHYKGHLYLVLGLAHDANDDNRTAVVYIGLELGGARKGARLAVRSYDDFYAWTDPATGESVSKDTPKAVPRFEYVGQTLEEKFL